MLFGRLVDEILRKISLDGTTADFKAPDADFLDYFQVPVHPKVVSTLGLRWADAQRRYNFHKSETLTFEEYVKRYIRVYG
jgi:hypothetical protein